MSAVPSTAAAATSATIDFSASGYTTGSLKPAGQNGWVQAKVADYSLVDNSSFPNSGLPSGGRSLQFSNSTIPSGGAHLVSPTIEAAGEPTTGATYNTFEAQFTVASATGALQTGLNVDVALDGASRYGGVVKLRHTSSGLEIGSYWVPQSAPDAELSSWRSAAFTTVDATVPHTIRLVAVFLEGRADSVQVFVDGQLVSGGSGVTTWEFYHLHAGTGGDKSVDGISFKSSSSAPSANGIGYDSGLPALPSAAGQGFLFSGISFASSTSAPPLPTTPPTVPATPDATPDAALTLADDSVIDELEFSATGYLAYENVYAALYGAGSFGGWFQADASGAVSGTVAVPGSVAYGANTLQLVGETGRVASAGFTKIPVPLPTDPPTLPTSPDPAPDAVATLGTASLTGVPFSATGFGAYENVYATVFSTPAFGGWFQADASGAVSGVATLPAELPLGSHTVQLTGSVSGWVASATFTKSAPPLPTTPPTTLPPAPDPTPDAPVEAPEGEITGPTVTIRAEGFDPFENVYVVFFSEPTFAGWLQADADGVVEATITLPAGLPAGEHTIQLVGETSGWTAAVQVEVAAAVPPAAVPPAAPLASTGLEIGPSLAAAVLLLAAGTLVGLARRRSSRRA
ncbi:hypothetical protein [Schumannella luteola]